MANCKRCGKAIDDGKEYCGECAAMVNQRSTSTEAKADESYLDSLLQSVVNQSEPARQERRPVKSTAKPVAPHFIPEHKDVNGTEPQNDLLPEEIPEEDITDYDILKDTDDSYLDDIFKEASEINLPEEDFAWDSLKEATGNATKAEKYTENIDKQPKQEEKSKEADLSEPVDDEFLDNLMMTVGEQEDSTLDDVILPEPEELSSLASTDSETRKTTDSEPRLSAQTAQNEIPSNEVALQVTAEEETLKEAVPVTLSEEELAEEAVPVTLSEEELAEEAVPVTLSEEELAEEAVPVTLSEEESESEEASPVTEEDEIDQLLGDLFAKTDANEEATRQSTKENLSKVNIVENDTENASESEADDDILEFWNSINGGDAVSVDQAPKVSDKEDKREDQDFSHLVPSQQEEVAQEPSTHVKARKKKKRGLLSHIFGNIREEISEEELEERKKAALVKLEEDEQKAAQNAELEKSKKLEKKQQKDEQAKLSKDQKAEKEKKKKEKQQLQAEQKKELKDKKLQAQKAVLEEIEQNEGKINKVGASLIFVIFAVVLCFIAIGTSVYTYRVAIENATFDFELQRYEEAYNEVYGLDIKEEDQELYDKIMTVQYVNTQLISYLRYTSLNQDAEALDSLMKGLRRYEKYIYYGTQLGIKDDLNYLRTQILNELSEAYQITEEQAYDMLNIESQEEYSAVVFEIVSKSE